MARFKGIRRSLAMVVGTVSMALMLGQAVPAAHAAPAAARISLVGTWLGTALGDGGGCDGEYGQFTFFRNGEYAYTSNSNSCGGFTNAGYFWLRNGVITLHWVKCNYPCAAGTASAGFAFHGANAFDLYDQGLVYEYYRQ